MFGFGKKKENFELVCNKKQEYSLALTNIFECLNASNNIAQANFVEKLQLILEDDDIDQFVKLINGIDFWGGSGAVWEVYIEDEKLSKKFESEIINLINLMEMTNILGKGISQIRKIFMKNS